VAIPPVVMKDMIKGPVKFSRVYEAEEFGLTSDKVLLTTSDGLNVMAYEVYESSPKAVVIFLSGIHNPSVTAFYGHSKMLAENGYASVLLEMRAHGESEGEVISLGYKEYLDVQAVVDHIKEDSKYANIPIVVYGLSMGGATAINAIGQIPEIDALISMSAYSSWEDAFCDNMVNMGAPKLWGVLQKPFVKLYTTTKFGLNNYNISPKRQIKELGDRPSLLIHSKEDSQIPYLSFQRIMENAPSHVETWVREGDSHFIVENDKFIKPYKDEEYAERIIGFLDKHFSDLSSMNTNNIQFEIIGSDAIPQELNMKLENLKQSRGYFILEKPDNTLYLFIGLGEKNTGGFSLSVKAIEEIEGTNTVLVEEKEPGPNDMVIQAITYPYIIVKMKNITSNFVVKSRTGEEFAVSKP